MIAQSNSLPAIAGKWQTVHTVITNPPAGKSKILGLDGERWAVILSCRTGTIYCSPWSPDNSAGNQGYQLPTNQSTLQFNYRDHGGLVQGEWYITSSGLGDFVDIVEIKWKG